MKRKSIRSAIALLLAAIMAGGSLPTAAFAVENGQASAVSSGVDLIPDTPNTETPNYVCTWSYQDWAAYSKDYTPVRKGVPRDILNHEQLFDKEDGYVYTAYPESRKDLIFLLDDGWDLPYSSSGNMGNYFGSLLVSPDKFPGYGETPEDRLKKLVENIEDAGWKGAGVWICANPMSSENDGSWNEDYWRGRMEWSKYAGIDYWKIDWGNFSGDSGWRQMISDLADEVYPELVIEHIVGIGTLNDSGENGTRLSSSDVDRRTAFASYSDVFRTYDVNGNLSIATSFERIGKLLEKSYTNGRQMGLLNGEDEVYMCSALGLAFGVMRYDIADASSGSLPNIFFGGDEAFTETRPIRMMQDDVQRATMWQRIAPAYRSDDYKTVLSDEALADTWIYSEEDTWDWNRVKDRTVMQKAPAAIARGVDMPEVTAVDGELKPFVSASRNPNGAVSIGTYGRTTAADGYQAVKADVSLNVGDLTGMIGVFGYYNSLTLTFNQDLRGMSIYAQDMIGDTAEDITNGVQISNDGRTVTFPGVLLERIGLSAKTENYSEPGLVIRIGEENDFVDAPATRYIPVSMVPNSSFELTVDGEADGELDPLVWNEWEQNNALSNFYVEKATPDSPAHTGEYYAVQKGDSAYRGGQYYDLTDMNNGVYDVSIWVKASAHTDPSGDPASACLVAKNYEPGNKGLTYAEIPQTDDWKQILIQGVPVTSGKLSLEIFSKANAGEYIYFDDVDVIFSESLNAFSPLFDSILEKTLWDNSVTEKSLLSILETTLKSYHNITVSIKGFNKTESTDDVDGAVSGSIVLSDNKGNTAEYPFNLSIPRISLVYNSSFEMSTQNGQKPDGWSVWARNGNTGSFYVESSQALGGAHSGDWYGIHWGRDGYDGSTYQVVKNIPTGMYKASVWIKNTAFTESADPCAACFVAKDFGQGTTGAGLKYVDVSGGNDEWTQFTIENIPVTNGQMQIEIYTKAASGKTQWIMFDDFAITPYVYSIVVEEAEHGNIQASLEEASQGKTVSLTTMPDIGYRLIEDSLKVYKTGDPSTEVEIIDGTFVMPGYPVTVTAKFEAATPEGVPVTGVRLKTTVLELVTGDSQRLTATVEPEGAANKNVTWSSSDEAIVTVTDDGLVTAVAAGTATVTVQTQDGNFEAACSVTVNDEAPVEPQTVTVRYNSKNVSLKVNGEPQKLADLTGQYTAKAVESGTEIKLTFEPRLEKCAFRSVTINGETDLITGNAYTYTAIMEEEALDLNFVFELTDKSILKLTYDYADKFVKDGTVDELISDVKDAFLAAYDAAEGVLNHAAATQTEIDDAWSDLIHVIHYLNFKPGDKSALEDLYDSLIVLSEETFTTGSWKPFAEAMAQAAEVVADKEALSGDISKAYDDLLDAFNNLEETSKLDQLAALIETAEAVKKEIEAGKYLPDGQNAFLDALEAAKAVDKDTSQSEVNEAVHTLTLTMAELRKKADKSELEKTLAELKVLVPADYTAESYAAVAKTIEAMERVLANSSLDDQEGQMVVDSVVKNGLAVLANLEKANKPVPSPNKGGNAGGSSANVSNNYGNSGVVAAGQGVVVSGVYIVSDTTVNFTLKHGQAYCFKMTVVNGNANTVPSFTVGNGSVLKTQFVAKIGNDYYYRVWAVGKPGESTGVYTTLPGESAVQHCTVTIG